MAVAPPREHPLWLKVPLNVSGPLGLGLALLGVLNAVLGMTFTVIGVIYVAWEIYPSARGFVKRRPLMSLPVFLAAGLVLGFLGWLFMLKVARLPSASHEEDVTAARRDTPTEQRREEGRVEFLLEAGKPLKSVALIVDLNTTLILIALGHFRALVTIQNLDVKAHYQGAANPNNPHPTLCIGGRDAYLVHHSGNSQRQLVGLQQLVYALNPNAQMQDTQFSIGQPTAVRIELGGGLYGKGPFKTIADMDERFVSVYVTEPLLKQIAAIHFVANNYVLFSRPAPDLARLEGGPLDKWPHPLTKDEEAVKWITLLPKGADYERFMKERQELGHDPPWFPSNLYREWIPSFDLYTPRRLP